MERQSLSLGSNFFFLIAICSSDVVSDRYYVMLHNSSLTNNSLFTRIYKIYTYRKVVALFCAASSQ